MRVTTPASAGRARDAAQLNHCQRPISAGAANAFSGALEDNYAALKWLYRNAGTLGVDRARVVLMGESAGGGHAAMLGDRGARPRRGATGGTSAGLSDARRSHRSNLSRCAIHWPGHLARAGQSRRMDGAAGPAGWISKGAGWGSACTRF